MVYLGASRIRDSKDSIGERSMLKGSINACQKKDACFVVHLLRENKVPHDRNINLVQCDANHVSRAALSILTVGCHP